jgi:hypothetical protein
MSTERKGIYCQQAVEERMGKSLRPRIKYGGINLAFDEIAQPVPNEVRNPVPSSLASLGTALLLAMTTGRISTTIFQVFTNAAIQFFIDLEENVVY